MAFESGWVQIDNASMPFQGYFSQIATWMQYIPNL